MMCDITVFENLLSRPSTRKQEAGNLTFRGPILKTFFILVPENAIYV